MSGVKNFYYKIKRHLFDNYPRFYKISVNNKYLLKFFLVGIVTVLIELYLLFLFHDLVKLDIIIATSLAYFVSFLVSFNMQKFWTFANYNQKRAPQQMILYIINLVIGLNLNAFIMHILVNRFYFWYIFSQVISAILVGGYNFLVYKFIIFKKEGHEVGSACKTIK